MCAMARKAATSTFRADNEDKEICRSGNGSEGDKS